ncbi:hypothetical protein AK812_SmicGene48495, partial [Symbiodinium microadriaticum]
ISSLSSGRTRGLWRSRCTIRRPIGASSSAPAPQQRCLGY